jgi:hypothetical protein
MIHDKTRFDLNAKSFSEVYYIIWNDIEKQRSMVIRYVLFNGGSIDTQAAEVWCWFRDQKQKIDKCYRQYYPLAQARFDSEKLDLTIGKDSGLNSQQAWGHIISDQDAIHWHFDLNKQQAVAIDRMPDSEHLDFFPQFQSEGCLQQLNAQVTINGKNFNSDNIKATDGHYWNVKHLQNWSWMNALHFKEDKHVMLEAIGFRLYHPDSPVLLSSSLLLENELYKHHLLESIYKNQETDSQLNYWSFQVEHNDLQYQVAVSANPNDMILIHHPLPDGSFLYTTISLCADVNITCYEKNANGLSKKYQLNSQKSASFEVTKSIKNKQVEREFIRIPAVEGLLR